MPDIVKVNNLALQVGIDAYRADTVTVQNIALMVATYDQPAVLVNNIALMVAVRADHKPGGGAYLTGQFGNIEDTPMVYTDLFFPECIAYGSTGSPIYLTDRIEVESGDEQRNSRRPYPRHEYSIRLENVPPDEISQIMRLWHVCGGAFAAFLFLDPLDHTSADTEAQLSGSEVSFTDQVIASALGTAASYDLIKTYVAGSRARARRIRYPKLDTLRVGVDGFEVFNWTYSYSTKKLLFEQNIPLTTANLTLTSGVISGAGTPFANAQVGDLMYFTGWATATDYNAPEGGDPLRITAIGGGGANITVENYDGTAIASASEASGSREFKSALPPTGAEITAGFYYYVPVRFEDDDVMESAIQSGWRESAHANFDRVTLREVFE